MARSKRRNVRVPWELPRELGEQAVHACLLPLRAENPARYRWLSQQTVVVRGERVYFCQKNVVLVSDMPGHSALDGGKSEEESLQGMRKDFRYWKLECLRDKAEVQSALFESLQSWKRTLGDSCLASPHRVASAVLNKCCLKAACPEYVRYTSGMLTCPEDSVSVADDKAKTMAWMVNKVRFQRAAVALVEQDTAHWSKEMMSPVNQGNENWDLHRRMTKRLKCRIIGQGMWGSPAYLTCTCRSRASVTTGALTRGDFYAKSRSLASPQDLSWYKHPAKSFYRGASRAMSIAVNRLRVGWETRSLKTASCDLKVRWEQMLQERGFRTLAPTCCRCKKVLTRFTLLVADAAQFYEEISPEQVLKDVQALLERVRSQGGKAVALRRSKRLAGYIASRETVNRTGYVSWPLDRIWCAFVLAMAQPHVRLGDVLYRQRNGIPIGGLVSKAATSCVLGVAEDSWTNGNTARRLGFGTSGKFVAVRYVDDVIMGSADLCRDCLTSVLQVAYPKGVQFDVAEPAAGDSDHRVQVDWLDLSVSLLRSGRLEVQAKINESDWACGKTETVGKHQVPPYVGPSGINLALLRGLIKGRAARFAQIGMKFRVLCRVMRHELLLWTRAGWPRVLLRSWWGHLRDYPEVTRAVQRCFRIGEKQKNALRLVPSVVS